jgi:hypothetical protein
VAGETDEGRGAEEGERGCLFVWRPGVVSDFCDGPERMKSFTVNEYVSHKAVGGGSCFLLLYGTPISTTLKRSFFGRTCSSTRPNSSTVSASTQWVTVRAAHVTSSPVPAPGAHILKCPLASSKRDRVTSSQNKSRNSKGGVSHHTIEVRM